VRLLRVRRPAGSSGGAVFAAAAGALPPAEASTAAPSFAPPQWLAEATGSGVRVAVIDSGWDRAIADARVLPGVGIERSAGRLRVTGDDRDRIGHGTGAAHQVLSIARKAVVIPIRVFGDTLETSPGAIVAALDQAVELRADVVNLSLGTTRADALRPLYAACERARRAGAVVVAAGDNFGEASWPAVFDHVIGVAMGLFSSPFEYRWRPDQALEIEAWGVQQPVAALGGGIVLSTGTSVAAPNVSGIVALLRQLHPRATLEHVRELLAAHAIG
jgi:minor extracellular protease Epr